MILRNTQFPVIKDNLFVLLNLTMDGFSVSLKSRTSIHIKYGSNINYTITVLLSLDINTYGSSVTILICVYKHGNV